MRVVVGRLIKTVNYVKNHLCLFWKATTSERGKKFLGGIFLAHQKDLALILGPPERSFP